MALQSVSRKNRTERRDSNKSLEDLVGETRNKINVALTVAHTHSHGDHVAGDKQFKEKPNTTVVGLTVDEIKIFFNIKNWPKDHASYDLG